ncbi:MAG: cation:proton antiporter [Oscillospiraceae bacterium]
MLISFAMILLVGMLMGLIFEKLKLPKLLGMMVTGIILSPYALNLIDPTVISISADLRKIALIIILARAGLALDIQDLKKVGRPAILMCFVPACFEILGVVLIAPKLFGISLIEAAIMGSVLAAVSPAVVVPKMLKLMKEGYGVRESIPQLIMAGASIDDVFVIVMFTAFTGLASGGNVSLFSAVQIPISIIMGLGLGIFTGICMVFVFKRFHMRDTAKVIVFISVSFLMVTVEESLKGVVPVSGMLAVMALGGTIMKSYSVLATRLSEKFSKLWYVAEIILFVLVGATVDLKYVAVAGVSAVLLIFGVLIFRMAGVLVCLIKTKLSLRERMFCMVAYMPKATVQAAIGAIPLAMGLSCGKIVLTVAVLSILITAPLGAFGIDLTYKKWLKSANEE